MFYVKKKLVSSLPEEVVLLDLPSEILGSH